MKIKIITIVIILKTGLLLSQKQNEWVDNPRKPYEYTKPVTLKITPTTDPKRAYDFEPQTTIKGNATGFFHVEKINNKWWYVDPKGYAFYATAMLGGAGHRWGQKLVQYTTNMEAKYGTQEKFWDGQVARLKSWNFNVWNFWGIEPLATPMPTIRLLEPMSAFMAWQDHGLSEFKLIDGVDWHDIPNVFHPDWEPFIKNYIKQMVSPFANSPWIMGYEVTNERDWVKVNTAALSAWKHPILDSAKQAWIDVAKCHGNIAYFNEAWKTQFASFDEVGTTTTIPSKAPTAEAEAMCWDFQNLVVDKFFKTTSDAIHEFAPNHLVLGARQHVHKVDEFFNAGFWETMGKYCDVITLNFYAEFVNPSKGIPTSIEKHLRGIHELTKRPIMISEWHPNGDVAQNEGYIKYNFYQKHMASIDFMIGTEFFQLDSWDENRSYGAVDINDVPYPDLEKAFKETNPLLHNLHISGKTSDYTFDRVQGLRWKEPLPEKLASVDGESFVVGDLQLDIKTWGWSIKKNNVDFGTFRPILRQTVNGQIRYPEFNKPVVIKKVTENVNYTVVQYDLGLNSNGAGNDIDVSWEMWIPKSTAINNGNWFTARATGAINTTTSTYNLDNIFYSIYTKEKAKPMGVSNIDINGWKTETNSFGLFDAAHQLGENVGEEAWIDVKGGQHTSMGWNRVTTMVGGQGFSENGPMAIFLIKPAATPFSEYDALKTEFETNCFTVDANFQEQAAWAIPDDVAVLLKKCFQEKIEVENVEKEVSQVILFPNPTNNSFKIEGVTTPFSYQLYNSRGRLVFKKENQNSEDEINAAALSPGIYLIKIVAGKNIYNKKIIVKEK